MTLCEFEDNTLGGQLDLLQAEGLYIGKRKRDNLTLLLFQLEDFYIELYYTDYRLKLEKVRTATCTSILEPYLDEILIEDLVF